MKKFLFVILIVGICAAAFFTRPRDPEQSFANYLNTTAAPLPTTGYPSSMLMASGINPEVQKIAEACDYKDHYLWVDVKYQGTTVYTSAFGHWFSRAEIKRDFQNGVEKAKDKVDHAADKLAGK